MTCPGNTDTLSYDEAMQQYPALAKFNNAIMPSQVGREDDVTGAGANGGPAGARTDRGKRAAKAAKAAKAEAAAVAPVQGSRRAERLLGDQTTAVGNAVVPQIAPRGPDDSSSECCRTSNRAIRVKAIGGKTSLARFGVRQSSLVLSSDSR